jgi:4-amino-4-deoxy-L-arabinose transferase-like glycosyltransferase
VTSRWLSAGSSPVAEKLLPCLFSAVIVFAIGWWANPRFERLGYDNDTEDYVSIAQNMSDVEVRDRPPVYPLLLRLCLWLFGDGWEHAIIVVQAAMLALTAAAVADVLRRMSVPPWAAVATASACCVTPGLLFMTGMVLPEVCLAMMLTLVWRATILLADPQDQGARRFVRAALLCGAASGVATLVKPVWILGAAPLAVAVLLSQRRSASRALALAGIIVLAHLALVLPWQLFLIQKYGQYELSRTGTANINMAGIRNGLTLDAAGTPLYEFLATTGLLDRALRLTWDHFDEFAQLKEAIPWEYRTDTAFD